MPGRRRYFPCIPFLLIFGTAVLGQEYQSDTATIRIREITILGSKIPIAGTPINSLAQVIPYAQLAASPANGLAEVLEYLPDLDVRQRGPVGIQSDISLRGGTFDQSAVLLNGISLNNPQTGHFSTDIPILLSMGLY